MQKSIRELFDDNATWMALLFVIVAGFFTYAFNFGNPPALFWDENYHIASAQKYLNGTYFMEPHPPLGKLLIAAGEKIMQTNATNDQFINTDYAQNPPAGFSFVGYRLFPVLLAWWTAALLFCIFLFLTRKWTWSLLLTFPYLFDNALIVHARSAMLESTMLFFAALTVLSMLIILEYKKEKKILIWSSVLFGAGFACLLATKAFGLIAILLVPFIVWNLWPSMHKVLRFLAPAAIAFVVVYCGIWQIHFSLGSTVNPLLPDKGYYQASAQYKNILDAGTNTSWTNFPIMLRDSLAFVTHYQRGVPRLDLCKTDENGSPWFYWPFGGRTINYRWETPDGMGYKYLYLVPNPVVWLMGIVALIFAAFLLLSSVFTPQHTLKNRPLLLMMFGLYVCFLIAVSQITRVMYLYHYFLPLFFSFLLIALVINELEVCGKWKLTDERKTWILLVIAAAMFLGHQFIYPLTYYRTIGDRAFMRRSLLDIWDLRCVHCAVHNPLVIPTKAPNS